MSEQIVQNKEQQILKVAEREFLEKGYDGARTTSIAKAAGVEDKLERGDVGRNENE